MKNTYLTILLLFISTLQVINAQPWRNLIPNYSFEKVTSNYPMNPDGGIGPTGEPDYYCYDHGGFGGYNWIKKYWAEIDSWTYPLRKSIFCGWSSPAVGTANVLRDIPPNHYARSGINRGFGAADEFFVSPLKYGGLTAGKLYYIEVFKTGSKNQNLYFAQGQPRQCAYRNLKPPKDGILVTALNIHGSNDGWRRTRNYFHSIFDLSWIGLGSDKYGGTWDDIRIYEVQPNKCRTNWYFDNTVFNYPNEVFQASNNIYVGNGVDPENGSNHIPGNVIQYANSKVVLRAGNQVIIDNTFIMENPNNVLILENSPCKSNLCPDKLHFENQILCNQPSKIIGPEPNAWGTTVHWSPSTYLDNPNISNPTFTAPSGTGAMEYTVTVTYHCDVSEGTHTETHHIIVQYVNSTDLSATVSASNTQWDDYHFSTDLNFSSGVTEIKIEVNSPPGYSKTYYRGVDFNCCNFNCVLPAAWQWSSCKNDEVKITAINKCSGQQSVITLPWNKATTPFSPPTQIPNVITPNGDGVNDQFCFTIPSADNYHIIILNRWSNLVFENDDAVKNNPLCLNNNFSSVNDGPYFYKITVSDDCGQSAKVHGYFHIFHGNNIAPHDDGVEDNRMLLDRNNQKDTMVFNNESTNSIILIPNPTRKFVKIKGATKACRIEIKDDKGKIIPVSISQDNTINVSNLSAGMYFVSIILENKVVVKKLVVL